MVEATMCDVCGGYGVVMGEFPFGDPNRGRVFACPNRNCEAGNRRRAAQHIRRARLEEISRQYLNYTLADFAAYADGKERAIAAAGLLAENPSLPLSKDLINREAFGRAWTGEDAESLHLVFYGDFGVGKTALAGAICNEIAKRHGEGKALMVRFGSVIEAVKESYKPDSTLNKTDILNRLVNAPILVLDEVKGEPVTPHSREILEHILRNRDAEDRPFILTTNWMADYFKEQWGNWASVIALKAHWIKVGGVVLRPQPGVEVF